MCGIASVLCSRGGGTAAELSSGVRQALERRGPDIVSVARPPCGSSQGAGLCLTGAVLHLRGNDGGATPQPSEDNRGNWLLWNGEAYDCGAKSDTLHVSALLSRQHASQ